MTSSPNEKLHPAQNPEVWDLEMVVATTWAVITACGWTPVTSSSIDRPGTRFLVRNALIGGPSFPQHHEAINAQMADARCRAQALIPAMRRSLHPASTIGRRLLLVIRDGRVHPSDLALPVTAVANQMRRGNVRGLIGPSDKARSARLPYDVAVGERIAVTGVAVKVRPIRGFSRGTFNIQLIIDCGSFTVKLVAGRLWVYSVEVGDEISVSGIVRGHGTWDDQWQTELTSTEPVAATTAAPNSGSSARRRRGGVRRRFPDDANTPTSALAQRTTP